MRFFSVKVLTGTFSKCVPSPRRRAGARAPSHPCGWPRPARKGATQRRGRLFFVWRRGAAACTPWRCKEVWCNGNAISYNEISLPLMVFSTSVQMLYGQPYTGCPYNLCMGKQVVLWARRLCCGQGGYKYGKENML